MIASARDIDVSGHDPYLIYHMLHREVSFEPPKGRRMRTGVVQSVLRNIFDNQVELTLNGQLFAFDEPVAIVRVNGSEHGSVVFVYGDLGPEMSDDELFDQMRGGGSEFYGETVDDILRRTRPKRLKTVEFLLGEKIKRRRTWRMKKTADSPA